EPKMPSPSVSISGQPSSSSMPLTVSGLFGHLSCASGMPSLSLSSSGQPSSSSKPSLSSATLGHLSAGPAMPSPSGSGLGGGSLTTSLTSLTSLTTSFSERSTSPKRRYSPARASKSGPWNPVSSPTGILLPRKAGAAR